MVGFDVGWIPVLSTIFEDFEVALFCEVSCMTKIFSSVNCYIYFWGSDFESEELFWGINLYQAMSRWFHLYMCYFGGFSYFSFIWSCVRLSLYCMVSLMTNMLSLFRVQPLIFLWWPWGSSYVFVFFKSRLVYIYKGLIDVVLWSISPGKYKSKLSLNFWSSSIVLTVLL